MKQRRVGTFTLGLSLILLGVLIPVGLINRTYCIRAIQLAPLLLVALGIEILIFAICFKSDKLKYDGLSIFMIISITVVSMVLGTFAPAFLKYTEAYREKTDTADEVREELYRAAKDEGFIPECRVYVGTDEWELFFTDNPELEYHAEVDLKTDKLNDNTSRKEAASMIYRYLSEIDSELDGLSYIRVELSGRNTDKVQSHKVVINDENIKAISEEYIEYELLTDIDLGKNGDTYITQIDYYGMKNFDEKMKALQDEIYPPENEPEISDEEDSSEDVTDEEVVSEEIVE